MMKCCLQTALARRVCCFRQTSPSLETRRPRHDGSQHGLARRSGPSTRLRQLSHGPEPLHWEGNLVRRLAWTAGLRSIATQHELYKGEKAPATSRPSALHSTCRVFSSKLWKAPWLSLSCRSRLKKSISAPRSREPQKSFAQQRKPGVEHRPTKSTLTACALRMIVRDWPS